MTTGRSAPGRRGADGPVPAESRFRAWRRARRRRLLRPLLVVVALGVLLAAGAWTALASSLFELRTVTVAGVARLSVAQVVHRAALPEGRSLLLIDPDAVARRVSGLPAVAAAHVERRWPHGIVIQVTERRPVAAVATGQRWTLVDLSGVAFATVGAPPRGLVPVRVGAPATTAGTADTRAAMAVFRTLPPTMRKRVAELQAQSPEAVSFRLSDGRDVVWGSPANGARKLAVLRALLHRRAAKYDVSAPGVAVTS